MLIDDLFHFKLKGPDDPSLLDKETGFTPLEEPDPTDPGAGRETSPRFVFVLK